MPVQCLFAFLIGKPLEEAWNRVRHCSMYFSQLNFGCESKSIHCIAVTTTLRQTIDWAMVADDEGRLWVK